MTQKIKISKAEVVQMIKEEYSKKITEIKLKKRLQQINEEMQSIISEEELDEVQAGAMHKTSATTVYGKDGHTEQPAAKFTKKGSHLIEDEEPEAEEIVTDEIPADDDNVEVGDDITMGDDESMEDELDIDAILAKLADAIEEKIETVVDAKINGEEAPEGEIEMGTEEAPEGEIEMGGEEKPEDQIDEQEGTGVVNAIAPKNATPFDNGKEEISKGNGLVSEATMKRMQILSGIRRNDFND